MDRWKDKVAIVTGASSGIGLIIARSLAENGIKVVAVARRIHLLQKLEEDLSQKGNQVRIKCMKCDISEEKDVKVVLKWIEDNWGVTSILVNNAGVFGQNSIMAGTAEATKNIFATNVFGMMNCCREVINSMKKHNIQEGHIININSTCGHHIMISNSLGTHTASKFAVTALTESLKNELTLAKMPIKVTSISPGLVGTEMVTMVPSLAKLPKLLTEDVANCVLFALSVPKHVNITELTVQPLGELMNTF